MSTSYPELYVIGLTGNIGCGKSTVSSMLAGHGAAICDADKVTRVVMQPDAPAYHAIVEAFGVGVLAAPGGPIDRPALGRLVFSEPAALQRLESIVHPVTRRVIEGWLVEQNRRAEEQGDRAIAVVDAIKLIEGGLYREMDAVWVVTCPRDEQVRRLVETRGLTEAEAEARIGAQGPQEEKVRHATVVIHNDGSLADLERQVCAAWRQLPIG